MSKNIAIFASGSGTNAENIIKYFQRSEQIKCALVLANKKDARVLERAENLRVPGKYIPTRDWQQPEGVISVLDEYEIDFIVLAGFLLKVPEVMVHKYAGRMVNIHPALLPKFGGKGMYGMHVHQAVIDAGDKKSGITIHQVNEHFDEGKIIYQAECELSDMETAESLAQKIHELEYQWYPKVIEQYVTKEFVNL